MGSLCVEISILYFILQGFQNLVGIFEVLGFENLAGTVTSYFFKPSAALLTAAFNSSLYEIIVSSTFLS